MNSKLKKQVIRCQNRNRDVEVTYAVSGSWYSPRYEITECQAMFEGRSSCNRGCIGAMGRPPKYMSFVMNSDRT